MVATLRNAHPHLQSAGRVFGTPASKEVPKFDPASVKLGGPMSLYKQEPRFYPSGWAARLVQENSKPDDPDTRSPSSLCQSQDGDNWQIGCKRVECVERSLMAG